MMSTTEASSSQLCGCWSAHLPPFLDSVTPLMTPPFLSSCDLSILVWYLKACSSVYVVSNLQVTTNQIFTSCKASLFATMCRRRLVSYIYSECGHPIPQPEQEVRCDSRYCKFSIIHPSTCLLPQCRLTCAQYRQFPEQYSRHISSSCPSCEAAAAAATRARLRRQHHWQLDKA